MTLDEKFKLKNMVGKIISENNLTNEILKKIEKSKRDIYVNQHLIQLNKYLIIWGLQNHILKENEITTDPFFINNEDLMNNLKDIGVIGGLGTTGIGVSAISYNIAAAPVFLGFGGGIGALGCIVVAAPLVMATIGILGILKYRENQHIDELIKQYNIEIKKILDFYIKKINKVKQNYQKLQSDKQIEIIDNLHEMKLMGSIMIYIAKIDNQIVEKEREIIIKVLLDEHQFITNSFDLNKIESIYESLECNTLKNETEMLENCKKISKSYQINFLEKLYQLTYCHSSFIEEKINNLEKIEKIFDIDLNTIQNFQNKYSFSSKFKKEIALLKILILISNNSDFKEYSLEDLINYNHFPLVLTHEFLSLEYKKTNKIKPDEIKFYTNLLIEEKNFYFELFYKFAIKHEDLSKRNRSLLNKLENYLKVEKNIINKIKVKYFDIQNDKTLVYFIDEYDFGIKDKYATKDKNHDLNKENFIDKTPIFLEEIIPLSEINIYYIGSEEIKKNLLNKFEDYKKNQNIKINIIN